MKTLDEVIGMAERCTLPYPGDCLNCEYFEDDSGNDCRCKILADALHYLKMLRDMTCGTSQKLRNTSQITCPKCHSEFVILPEANNALTWSELRQMEGKPVWVEGEHGCIWNQKAWSLIRLDPENDDIVICISTDGNMHYEYAIGKEDYGTDWQAYRKERE